MTTRAAHSRRSWAAFAGAVAITAAIVAGCTSGSTSAGNDPAGGAGSIVVPSVVAASAAPERGAQAPDAGADLAATAAAATQAAAGGAAAGAPGRLTTLPVNGSTVIKTADLAGTLSVPPAPATDNPTRDSAANATARAAAVTQAADAVRAIAAAAGGFQSNADGGGSVMTIGLRVPADRYDTVIDKLAGVGELTSRTETSQDVTAEVVDVKSRVESMTASVARVRALLSQATTIADIIAIESELSVREANLESLQQQQAYLDGQVAMSTVSLTLTAVTAADPTVVPVSQDTGFVAGIKAGWSALLAFVGWAGGAVGAVLPFLPLLAVAGLLVWWLVRLGRRRTAARRIVVGTGDPTG